MERSWKYRRGVVFVTVGFCMFVIAALVVLGKDTMIYRELAQGAWALLGWTIGAYMFGAVWDDRNKAREIIQGLLPQV